jgi:DNA-binding CsgD family transcriptional regulator
MTRYSPRSQNRGLLHEKELVARRLLSQGLTVAQIAGQLRCSPQFVRRIRTEGTEKPG